jgi:hypothetical protein
MQDMQIEKLKIEKKIERNNFIKSEIKKTLIIFLFGLALLIIMQTITSII